MATNVSTSLPQLTLEERAILTVDTLDSGAIITSLVIHFTQDIPDLPDPTAAVVYDPFAYAVAGGSSVSAP